MEAVMRYRFQRGEDNVNWVGDKASYHTIHEYIRINFIKPDECQICGSKKNGNLQWANLSGEYTRDIKDYIAVCQFCHKEIDAPTHCKRGHELDEVNTYLTPDGKRQCNACRRYLYHKRKHAT